MSNEEMNNETETLAILGGDRPTLFETQFVSMRCVLNSEEYQVIERLLSITMGIFPCHVLTLLRSEAVLESLSRYDEDKQSSDFRSALAKIRATVDLMGEVRMSFWNKEGKKNDYLRNVSRSRGSGTQGWTR